ncbi:hypothetical protein VP1G_10680 [Cytospora mali]|uniref:Uncharacterized protein n=1 Tax=Cytospora mali TaxID=578113 RepID=A0A194URW7_CYTMA|nr:hypothetical protein VP1G_10680 [Valsa mali var. pyri (nom. inval.)]
MPEPTPPPVFEKPTAIRSGLAPLSKTASGSQFPVSLGAELRDYAKKKQQGRHGMSKLFPPGFSRLLWLQYGPKDDVALRRQQLLYSADERLQREEVP